MKTKKGLARLEGLVVILVCAFLALAVFAVWQIIDTPLAEAMNLTTDKSSAVLSNPSSAQPAAASVKQAETCGNTGSWLVLFTGEDTSKGKWPLGADAVRVIKVDFDNKKITVVAFSRDLWVKTAGLAAQNYPETELGLAYYYKKQATNGSDKHKVTVSTELVAQALVDNFDLAPQKYFTLQLDSTAAMIDTIGGVDVLVPQAITTEYGTQIPAGQQLMSGAVASEYVRTFVQGDATRLERQNLFIKALQEKVLNANILPKVPDLYKQFDKAIVTDLTPKQISELACMAKEVPQSQIDFHEIEEGSDLVTVKSGGILMPKVDAIKAALKEWFGQ